MLVRKWNLTELPVQLTPWGKDGADLYQLSGSNNGVLGRFEWIVENGEVTHRMFIENGTMNRRPILPW